MRLFLDSVELRDALDGLACDGRTLSPVNIYEFTPDMGHASDLADVAGTIEVFEPGIAVSVHPTLIFCEVIFGVLPFAIWGELIPTGGWRVAVPWAFIPAIGPKPGSCGFAGAWCEHLDGCVVCKDGPTGQHMPPDGICQRFQHCCEFANPIHQR